MLDLNPEKQQQFAVDVVEKLRAAGFDAYWAGGCVRDQLLGRTPKDYDVATSAKPDEIQRLFGKGRSLAIGAAFGVITVIGPKQAGQVEVATFREDAGYSDGRHPDAVTFSTPQRDAQRRDFTINGLFYDPHAHQVIDFVDGQADVERGVIRAIGRPHDRFHEDKLRMLRAVRFATAYAFALDAGTEAAIRELAAELPQVSAERISMETRLILVHPHRARGMQMLDQVGLLAVVLPEIYRSASELSASTDWQMTQCALAELEAPSFPLALATLLQAFVTAAEAEDIGRRWKLSNRETELVGWLIANQRALEGARQMPWSQLQRILISPDIRELIELHRAVAVAQGKSTADLQHCEQKLQLPVERLNPRPLLTGDDLIAHGLPPGKHFQGLLEALRDAQLEGRVRTRTEALSLADELAKGRLEGDS